MLQTFFTRGALERHLSTRALEGHLSTRALEGHLGTQGTWVLRHFFPQVLKGHSRDSGTENALLSWLKIGSCFCTKYLQNEPKLTVK